MMKTKMKKLDFKTILIVFLSVLGALIIAGSIVVGCISFNGDSTTANNNVLELTSQQGTIGLLTDGEQNKLLNEVEGLLKNQGLKIKQKDILAGEGGLGTKLQFVSSSSFGDLERVCNDTNFNQSLKDLSYFKNGNGIDTPVLSFHSRVYMPYYEHIWRAAVAIGVVLVVWFVYMAIRYRLAMSLTAIIMLLLDGLAMLAVVALCRIPVGISLMGSLVVTLLFSVLCSTILFANMYKNFKKPDWQNKTLSNAIYTTTAQNQKLIIIISAIIGILLGGITIVSGCMAFIVADLFGFALSTFLGVAISVANTLFLTPAIFYHIQMSFDTGKVKKGKKVYLAGKDLTLKKSETIE